jgi:trimeric autotransporter adhesin
MKIFRLLVAFTLICFALPPAAQAVVPAPDGGYPGANTAEGQNALLSLTSGGFNTAVGYLSLRSNTDGSFNTALGAGALLLNSGDSNTATGTAALLSNTSGSQNTAIGTFALFSNTTGSINTAAGYSALRSNTTGTANVAIGLAPLGSNTTGTGNVAIGDDAGFFATTGDRNVYIGALMLGVAGEAEHTYIRNINTTPVSGGGTDTVTVDLTTGLLGHLTSSRRYKEDIKPMDKGSEALYRFQPVTYRFKKQIDPTQSTAFGLIAEEVAEVNPNLVAHNSQGQPETVHYEMINAMLLNEFLKEHRAFIEEQRKVEKLEATVAQQHKDFEAVVNELKGQIQKVNARLELSKGAPQTVLNNQ